MLPAVDLADASATLRAYGCLACHDVGSAANVGPPLGALQPVPGSGEAVSVWELRPGESTPVLVKVDDAHLLQALADPGALVRDGYPAGVMPAVAPHVAAALVPVLTSLRPDGAPAPRNLAGLGASAFAFCFGHLAMSAQSIRAPLVRRFGAPGFMGVYSVVIGAAFAALLWTWAHAPFVPLWSPAPWTRFVPLLVLPFVFVAQVAGYSTPSPTLAGQDGLLATRVAPVGIQRITRHPVNVSTSLWAAAHLFPNGDVASVCLFGSVAVLGILGSAHIDRRLAALHGDAWARYAAQTSLLPFVAILQGRTRLVPREIGWVRTTLGVALFVGALLVHTWVIGASPYPTGW